MGASFTVLHTAKQRNFQGQKHRFSKNSESSRDGAHEIALFSFFHNR